MSEKVKKSLNVLVDLDDVMIDTLPAWVAWLDKEYDLNVRPEDVTSWYLKNAFPTLSDKQLYTPLRLKEFWRTVEPKEGAVESINELIIAGHNVYIVTDSSFSSIMQKISEVILIYFKTIKLSDIIITSHKDLVKGDVIIDDAPFNLLGNQTLKLLFDAPHNSYFPVEKFNVTRIKNWKEIMTEIKSQFADYF